MGKAFIHTQAIVDSATIGHDTKIWAFTHVLTNATIGSNVMIGEQCFVENKVIIGNNVTIKNGVSLWDGIIIEDNVFVGPYVTFTNDMFPRSKQHDYDQKSTVLRAGCSLGANSTILPGITIGSYAMIGAGSVVTKNVEDFAVVYGNPAEIHGYICICTQKLQFEENVAHCTCGRKYSKNDSVVKLYD